MVCVIKGWKEEGDGREETGELRERRGREERKRVLSGGGERKKKREEEKSVLERGRGEHAVPKEKEEKKERERKRRDNVTMCHFMVGWERIV
jgi:hypothetical protein